MPCFASIYRLYLNNMPVLKVSGNWLWNADNTEYPFWFHDLFMVEKDFVLGIQGGNKLLHIDEIFIKQ